MTGGVLVATGELIGAAADRSGGAESVGSGRFGTGAISETSPLSDGNAGLGRAGAEVGGGAGIAGTDAAGGEGGGAAGSGRGLAAVAVAAGTEGRGPPTPTVALGIEPTTMVTRLGPGSTVNG